VAIRSPTVPAGAERLRITLTAGHQDSQVDGLIEALSRICAPRSDS
jgi:8-amino-7-oxononanoate synthase